jgi:protein SCO1/2
MTRLTTVLVLSLAAAGCAARHQASGLVLKVDPPAAQITVSHEAIPGYMEAMVMPFTAADAAELRAVKPGDRIAFRINVRRQQTRIDRVRLLSAAPADAGLVASPAAPVLVSPGSVVPDFTLTNQHHERVSLSSLRGRVVALTFIYSRCPLPDYCPRVVSHLSAVRDRFRERMNEDLVLLTITFDPKYDTPEALKSYAGAFKANVPGWHFLTGTSAEIERACSLFGVEYWPDEGLITHTLQTAVIDRDGRLAATIEGKDFTARQLGDLVQLALAPKRP